MKKTLNTEKIEQALLQEGLNQSNLAELLDVTRQSVSKWMNGDGCPRPAKLLKLSRILGLNSDELLVRESQGAPVVAFRKMKSTKTTEAHFERAKVIGQYLEQLVPYLPFDALEMPPVLRNPSIDYGYLNQATDLVRKHMGLDSEDVVSVADLVKRFGDLNTVLIPVLWGSKDRHENAMHIHLPNSMSTWVFLNLNVNQHDFKFWMAHELGHSLTPEFRGDEAEDFADAFAGRLLYPAKFAKELYSDINKLAPGIQVNSIKAEARRFGISPYNIYLELEAYANENGLEPIKLKSIHGATTNFNKDFKNMSEKLFDNESPSASKYVDVSESVFCSPFFRALKDYISKEGKSASYISTVMDLPLLDAKGIFAELV
ncbi:MULTISPECIES: helix-turn-helix domain-containing protein [Vibrio]|uniref:helix-turn-helix domain-containing protein n=1 Tax=Vibrio TaxID=662 RepID=UPI000C84A9E7|nr:helix-turn-helix domain-containing protein [Vibrio cyclitrophicus]PME26150.1 hypothetical protein BCV41_15090 [Vibrio cyclitrophicus]